MERNIIPVHPCSVLFNGKSGSGKTVLLSNLLSRFYRGYFTKIYLFSGSPDDIFDTLKITKKFTDVKEWDSELGKILKKQESEAEKKGIQNTNRTLIIMEDIINHASWMRKSPYFTKLFVANRHYGVSTFITTQSWTRVPRACRLNCSAIYFFEGSDSELKLLTDEYCPSKLSKADFRQLVGYCWANRYSFLSIYTRLPVKTRFRCNLDIMLEI